jgi:predicted solute-binding protein
MIRGDRLGEAGELFAILSRAREEGSRATEQLLDRYAAEKSWPRDLARKYFTEYLRYEVTLRAREGLARFFELAAKHQLLPTRPIVYYNP